MRQEERRPKSCHKIVGCVICISFLTTASFAEEEAKEPGWTGDLALAFTAQSGTTDTFAGTLDAKTERVYERDQLKARFNGVYGKTRARKPENKAETIQNSQGLFGDWKRTIQDRFFWQSGTETSRDSTQDRELRVAIGTGPGYRLWRGEDREKRHFDVAAGFGYRYEVYDGNSNSPGDDTQINNFADAILALEYRNLFFDDRLEYLQTASAKMPVNDISAYILRSEMILGVPLSESWSLRTSFLVEYVNSLETDETNRTTTRTAVGLGYTF